MNFIILIFFCGFLYNCYKFIKNKQDTKFLNIYFEYSMKLYNILIKKQEYDVGVLAFLSHNSVRFDRLVPDKANFPHTKIWIIEFMLNNFSNLYNNQFGIERKLVASTKYAIMNTIESRIGELELEKNKILFRFFPLFFISNFFEFCFILFIDGLSINFSRKIKKAISFIAEIAGIFGTIAAFSNEFVEFIRKIFISLF